MSLESLLRWSWFTSVPPTVLLTTNVPRSDITIQQPVPRPKGEEWWKRPELTPKDFLDCLDRFLHEQPLGIPSIAGISRTLGTSPASPACSPSVRTAIRVARSKRQFARKKATIWKTVGDVHKAVFNLHLSSRTVTIRNITSYLGAAITKDPVVRRYISVLRQQIKLGRMPPNPVKRLPHDVRTFWEHCDLI